MAENPGNPITPGLERPIVTLPEAALELLAKGRLLQERVRFLGFFTIDAMAAAGVAPAPGDCWVQYDPPSGAYRVYLQITDRPRLRVYWSVTIEGA